MAERIIRSKWAHLLALTAVLLTLAGLMGSSRAYFSSDVGLRFLQARELVANRWQTLAVTYPAQAFDPDLQFVPYYYAWSLLDGRIYLNVSPFFPLALSFFYALTGPDSVIIVPVLGGVLAAAAVYVLARTAGLRRPLLALWLTVFATPLLFYSLELWDHSWAAAAAAWAVAAVAVGLRRGTWLPVFWGGVAAGVGLGQRPEMYVFAIALGVGLLAVNWRRLPALAAGGLAGALPVWLLQWRWVGHPLGLAMAPHLLGYGRPPTRPASFSGVTIPPILRVSRLLFLVNFHEPVTFAALLLAAAGIGFIVLTVRVPHWQRPIGLWLGLVSIVTAYGLLLWYAGSNPIPGLISVLPLIGLSLVVAQGNGVYRLTFIVAIVFVGLMLAVWPAFGGAQWGSRYLLPAVPLFLFLAVFAWEAYAERLRGKMRRAWQTTAVGLLTLSVIVQLAGLRAQWQRHQAEFAMRAAVSQLPAEMILTNSLFVPAQMASLPDKHFMYTPDEAALAGALLLLAEGGARRVAFIPDGDLPPLPMPERIPGWRLRPAAGGTYKLERE
ncbi:MAG TPA: hypothetical protein ENK32_04100 [Anaerolineae bacterium]|nr:hypothetical protein [Anaerolineae bacterium]